MSNLVSILVDGKEYLAPEGAILLEWGNEQGFNIPYFCSHPKLSPWGACRMCVVKMGSRVFDEENNVYTGEIRWMPKLQISCSIRIAKGQAFEFDCPEVQATRRSQIELHLINHPLECPVCDKGGECQLQDWSYTYGPGAGRFVEAKREEPDFEINEFIQLNYKRCIICKRCVRFHHEIAQDYLMEFKERGYHTELFSFPLEVGRAQSKFAGNSIDICPVGAITSKAFHFRARIWELNHTDSIDPFDSGGTNISVHHYKKIFARITPRDTWPGFSKSGGLGGNLAVDFGWCSDKVRFCQDYVYNDQRAQSAAINGQTCSVSAAAKQVAELINSVGPDKTGILAGSLLTNEEYIELLKFIESKKIAHFYFGDPLELGANDSLAATGLFAFQGSVEKVCRANTVFMIGCDLLEEAPVQGLFLERLRRENPNHLLISMNPYPTEIERHANYCMPYQYGNEWAVIDRLQAILDNNYSNLPFNLQEQLSVDKSCAIVIGKSFLTAPNAAELITYLTNIVVQFNKRFCNTYLNPVLDYGNSAGALLLSRSRQIANAQLTSQVPEKYSDFLNRCINGDIQLLIALGCDPIDDSPYQSLATKAVATVPHRVVLNLFKGNTGEQASVFIPAVTHMEKQGTWFSSFARLQQLDAADIPVGDGISEYEFLRLLKIQLGTNGKIPQPAESFGELAGLIKPELPSFPIDRFGLEVNFNCQIHNMSECRREPLTTNELVVVPRKVMYDQIPIARNCELFSQAIREPECWMAKSTADQCGVANRDWIAIDLNGLTVQARVKIKHSLSPGFIVLPDRLSDCNLSAVRSPNKLIVVNNVKKLQDASVFLSHRHKVDNV